MLGSVPGLAHPAPFRSGAWLIELDHLSKLYGSTRAVDDLSFKVSSGRVTGFLGPNGAGKSTSMRLILSLDMPTSGDVRVNGVPYSQLRRPLWEVGALLDAHAVHPGRSARNHLRCLAEANGISLSRVEDVLKLVGLDQVARRRLGTFSLGMSQRLGIAAALLGDPGVLLFDEPLNGLDPEGILWVRNLLRSLAGEGRTVFVSSHLMSEMALMADEVVVIGRGRLIVQTSLEELTALGSQASVVVRSPDPERLRMLVEAQGARLNPENDGSFTVNGMQAATLGELAAEQKLPLHELTPKRASLEEVFMELTQDSAEFRATVPGRAVGEEG